MCVCRFPVVVNSTFVYRSRRKLLIIRLDRLFFPSARSYLRPRFLFTRTRGPSVHRIRRCGGWAVVMFTSGSHHSTNVSLIRPLFSIILLLRVIHTTRIVRNRLTYTTRNVPRVCVCARARTSRRFSINIARHTFPRYKNRGNSTETRNGAFGVSVKRPRI